MIAEINFHKMSRVTYGRALGRIYSYLAQRKLVTRHHGHKIELRYGNGCDITIYRELNNGPMYYRYKIDMPFVYGLLRTRTLDFAGFSVQMPRYYNATQVPRRLPIEYSKNIVLLKQNSIEKLHMIKHHNNFRSCYYSSNPEILCKLILGANYKWYGTRSDSFQYRGFIQRRYIIDSHVNPIGWRDG